MENLGKLVSYERTKADATEAAREYKESTGIRCTVTNTSRARARKNSYDKPWCVREAVVR